MSENITIFGLSITDAVGLGIGFTAAILSLITLALAIVIFFLGARHSKHLTEVENARKNLSKQSMAISDQIESNTALLSEMHLGFHILGKIAQLQSLHKKISSINSSGRSIDKRLYDAEIEKILFSMEARHLELHILINGGERSTGPLIALSVTFGDQDTIDFLSSFSEISNKRGSPTRALYECRGNIEARMHRLIQ